MCRKNVLTIVVVAISVLAMAANAEQMLISVSIDTTEREEITLDGPVDGDGGSDVGTTWNQLLGGPGNPGDSLTMIALKDSMNSSTTVVFTSDLGNIYEWGTPDLAMLTSGAFQWVPTSALSLFN